MNTTATQLTIRQQALVLIPGNQPGKRIGLVVFGESGYYPQTFDAPTLTKEEATALVGQLNEALGIPDDVAEAMLAGSMFGWSVPAAARARLHFGQHPTPPTAAELRAQRADDAAALLRRAAQHVVDANGLTDADWPTVDGTNAAAEAVTLLEDTADAAEEEDATTYRIVRFYQRPGKAAVALDGPGTTGLTLKEAQERCHDPQGNSKTTTSRIGRAHTRIHGDWFEGYTEE